MTVEETVKGVLVIMDSYAATSGTLHFAVDGVECPDSRGAGTNAQGGAFNCNLSGY